MKKIIHTSSLWLHYAAQITLALMMLIITFDVLGRWIFHKPIAGAVDFVSIGLSIVIFLSLAFTHLKKDHITIDFVVEKFSRKTQLIFEIIINIIITFLMILLTWSLIDHMLRLFHSNTVTGDLSIPVYLFAILAFLGTFVFALVAIESSIKYYKEMISDES